MGHLTLCLAKITFQMSAHEGCVVVTGAAGGIGRNICRVLNKKGFKVILVDKVGLGPLEDELGLTGKNRSFQVDLKDFDKVEEMVKRVDSEHGGIKVLINNAGINLGPCLFKKEAREVVKFYNELFTFGFILKELAGSYQRQQHRNAQHHVGSFSNHDEQKVGSYSQYIISDCPISMAKSHSLWSDQILH